MLYGWDVLWALLHLVRQFTQPWSRLLSRKCNVFLLWEVVFCYAVCIRWYPWYRITYETHRHPTTLAPALNAFYYCVFLSVLEYRSYKRYFYLNEDTGATQWDYPDDATPPQPPNNQSESSSGEPSQSGATSESNSSQLASSTTSAVNPQPPPQPPPPDSSCSVVSSSFKWFIHICVP